MKGVGDKIQIGRLEMQTGGKSASVEGTYSHERTWVSSTQGSDLKPDQPTRPTQRAGQVGEIS